ncbi:MAG: FAD-dependent thymidylate synthase [Puniceicoccales bacterium]|jgi:thymidylate synthase (FAD)|nr:FAD-dependent thymidylate synthase [Puniceicoccales bacterium]
MRKILHVELLAHTPDAEDIVFAAFRQCYSSGFVMDTVVQPRRAGKISAEEREHFLQNVLMMGHASPLEHVSFTFAIEGISRACSHQLIRHRIASYSQQSQRYCAEGEELDYILPPSIARDEEAKRLYEAFMRQAGETYARLRERMQKSGCKRESANEDARFVLPNAAETKLVATFNARSLLHFLQLRCCSRAQWEIRALARRMGQWVQNISPTLFSHAGPSCEQWGVCFESPAFSCGRKPPFQPPKTEKPDGE